MFTGIVSHLGRVRSTDQTPSGIRLVVGVDTPLETSTGDSIAVNGVCLTVVAHDGTSVSVDVVPETLDKTSLGAASEGTQVNLELAMPATGRFDGHIVQGHVDGTGTVESITRDDGAVTMRISSSQDLMRYVVHKGSVTVDGVSLTVASTSDDAFTIALIPHTLEVTNLSDRAEGDAVNIETDVLAKYVERLVGTTR